MRKSKRKYRDCGRTIAIVLLLSFLPTRVFAEPLTEPPEPLSEGGMIYYSDLEVESLIEELSAIAREAIEQAGAEAAKAAALAAVEQQAELLQEKAAALREAERLQTELDTAHANGRKHIVMGIMAGFLGGIAGVMVLGN